MADQRIFRLIAQKTIGVLKPMLDDIDVQMVNRKGWTVFHAAVHARSRPILSMFLQHNKKQCEKKRCDINARDDSGHTPFDRAVIRNFSQGISLLIREGASVWHRHRVTGNTPLHVAVSHGHEKIIQKLLCMEDTKDNIDIQNEHGYTAIHVAVFNGNYECYTLLQNAGANMTLLANDRNFLAHIVARINDNCFIKELLDLQPDFDLLE